MSAATRRAKGRAAQRLGVAVRVPVAGARRATARIVATSYLCLGLLSGCGESTADAAKSAAADLHAHGESCLAELHEVTAEQGGGRIEVWRCDPTPLLPVAETQRWFRHGHVQPVVPVDGLDPVLRANLERFAPITALHLDATLEVETPRSPDVPIRHTRISGTIASDGRFSLRVAQAFEDDRGVLILNVQDTLYDGSNLAFGDVDGGEYSVFPADSRHMPAMLEHGNDAAPLLHWMLTPLPLSGLNTVDTTRTAEQNRYGHPQLRITRGFSTPSLDRAAVSRGALFDVNSGHFPLGAYALRPSGGIVEEFWVSDHREIVPGIWRPMHWTWRRFRTPGDQPTNITRLQIHRAEAVSEALDELFALSTLPAELWHVTQQ